MVRTIQVRLAKRAVVYSEVTLPVDAVWFVVRDDDFDNGGDVTYARRYSLVDSTPPLLREVCLSRRDYPGREPVFELEVRERSATTIDESCFAEAAGQDRDRFMRLWAEFETHVADLRRSYPDA